MQQPDFLLCYNRDQIDPLGLILFCQPPWYTGKIWLFKDTDEYSAFIVNYDGPVIAIVPDYKIVITWKGTLVNGVSKNDRHTNFELFEIFRDMGKFYLKEKVEHKPGYYKKYKI